MLNNNVKKTTDNVIKPIFAAVMTILFCASMTAPAKSSDRFDQILNLMMFLCIICGLLTISIRFKKSNKIVVITTALYLIARLISYYLNDLPLRYGGALMLQVFYLVGICTALYGSKQCQKAALYSFLAFDICALGLCQYLFHFRPEYIAGIAKNFEESGFIPELSLFQNTNYVGMMTGAAIIICFSLIMNNGIRLVSLLLGIPVIGINLYTLIKYTGCRSAITGLLLTALIVIVITVFKKLDSVKTVVGTILIACFLTLIPLYALVYWGDSNEYLFDRTAAEQLIEAASSQRYTIWKTTILSQEGHELFGFGSSTKAWDARKEFVYNFDFDKVDGIYIISPNHKRQHNGYLAAYNETGIIGTVCLLLLLLARIRRLKGRFRDGQWEKLLLIYIFWINLFEAKFVLHVFFTGFLMMVLLLPPEEEKTIN